MEQAEAFMYVFDEAYTSDEESNEKKGDRLLDTYMRASQEHKNVMSDVMITLCGYSFDTLIKKAGQLVETGDYHV